MGDASEHSASTRAGRRTLHVATPPKLAEQAPATADCPLFPATSFVCRA